MQTARPTGATLRVDPDPTPTVDVQRPAKRARRAECPELITVKEEEEEDEDGESEDDDAIDRMLEEYNSEYDRPCDPPSPSPGLLARPTSAAVDKLPISLSRSHPVLTWDASSDPPYRSVSHKPTEREDPSPPQHAPRFVVFVPPGARNEYLPQLVKHNPPTLCTRDEKVGRDRMGYAIDYVRAT